ncbi:MAG: hypothetical protein AVDCRST_MAG56-284 [uncultured Cytophagales bacterium]|uniref:Transposase IS4-like domain-containing protein n=1 Tax=uncultured Cytophagales bacterium TaxID=158755 RepID=A0A6J4HB23_9SPHI|nr:MAG: hypothetical protein AVDCRST_MAG56-284 [uncultured Cytophagales bacterium]
MWAASEFAQGLAGFHKRNGKSLIKAAELIYGQMGRSFSAALGNTFRQAVAGIFSKAKMNTDKMLEGHVKATVERCQSSDTEVIIAAQDTTLYNLTTHQALQGVGTLQGKLKGTLQHNVLACDEQGVPLGLLYQRNWTRGGLNALDNESDKWLLGLQAVNEHLSGINKRVVLVQDREADVFDFFRAKRAPNVDLLVRVHQPRKVEVVASGVVLPLQQAAQALPVVGEMQVHIERNNRPVALTLKVSGGAVAVLPPKDLSARKHTVKDLYLVVAREVAAIDGQGRCVFDEQQAAEWLLLTSYPLGQGPIEQAQGPIEQAQGPIEQAQGPIEQASDAFISDALRVVGWYALRWRIERLHYVLKSGGLQVERLQFETIEVLFNAFAFYSIVAWRVLYLTYLARQDCQSPAQEHFDALELQLLKAHTLKVSSKPAANKSADNKPADHNGLTTLKQAVVALGRLVNFQPTTKQPLPGVKLLAQALVKLHHMKEAILIWQNLSLQD